MKQATTKAGQKPRRSVPALPARILARVIRYVLLSILIVLLVGVCLTLPLRWLNPPVTAFMLQDDSGRDAIVYEWTNWHEIGESLALAVIAAEDQRFDRHHGLDFHSIQDALADAREGAPLRGASTITQQVVKNLYLWPGRDLARKGIEVWLALNLDLFLPKKRILEIYLNIIELGPGIYGANAASNFFFGRKPISITPGEAALLAAVLPNPIRFNAGEPTAYIRQRQAWIMSHMQRLKREDWLRTIQ